MEENKMILATTDVACEYIYRSSMWRDWVLTDNDEYAEKIRRKYSQQLETYGTILPQNVIDIQKLGKILYNIENRIEFEQPEFNMVTRSRKKLGENSEEFQQLELPKRTRKRKDREDTSREKYEIKEETKSREKYEKSKKKPRLEQRIVSPSDIKILYNFARILNVKKLPKLSELTNNINLIKALVNLLYHMYEVEIKKIKPLHMLYIDKDVKEGFHNFLKEKIASNCYISREQQNNTIDDDMKEIILTYDHEEKIDEKNKEWALASQLSNLNISVSYIEHLLQDNLAQNFPDLFLDSNGEQVIPQNPLVPYAPTLWENRPIIPKYVMLWGLKKLNDYGDVDFTNFVAAKKGLNSTPTQEDYDIYGQLICSNNIIRSGGMGKAMLIATILMAYQYKINYIFIQAFLGITSVQGALYNRLGLRFEFPDKLLRRKTAFFQWTDIQDEKELDTAYQQYLNGNYEGVTNRMKLLQTKFKHLTYLQPMWLYVRGYDTSYACDLLTSSGFDYQTKGKSGMSSNKKWLMLPARLSGMFQEDVSEETKEKSTKKSRERFRKQDGEHCDFDEDCLSDYCYLGKCTPYDYDMDEEKKEKPSILRELDEYLDSQGLGETDEERKQIKQKILEQEEMQQEIQFEKDFKKLTIEQQEDIAKSIIYNKKLVETQITDTEQYDEVYKKYSEISKKYKDYTPVQKVMKTIKDLRNIGSKFINNKIDNFAKSVLRSIPLLYDKDFKT
jgi:hypothetical protein